MSTDRWVDKEDTVNTHSECYWAIKGWNNDICSNMDGPRVSHTKSIKPEKDKYRMMSVICGIWNMIQINLFIKQKKTHRHREQTNDCQRESERRGKLGVWD